MPNENRKQLTAMQILYNRNQEIIDRLENTNDPCQYEYCKALISVNDEIDTELLATERQHLIDFYNLGRDDKTAAHIDAGEDYFRKTFKTQ